MNNKAITDIARVMFSLVLCFQLLACVGAGGVKEPNDKSALSEQVSVGQESSVDDSTDERKSKLPTFADDADESGNKVAEPGTVPGSADAQEPGALTERVRVEQQTAFNPYVITAHKHNFILPISYSSSINEDVYARDDVLLRDGLRPVEVKFQISLKTRLNEKDIAFPDDALSLGITLDAWWQLYSDDISSPFRETNYQPEVFYLVPLLWGPFGGSTALVAGLEHQSNGQVQGLSRSWNRIYGTLIYEKGAFVGSIRPWYRLPENEKDSPGDADGDDNPDILDFMGHGELRGSWRNDKYEYAMMVRGNPSTGKGAFSLGMTFPFYARFRGFVEYFNGYGDSLIDYNHFQQRVGLGVALTNLF